MTNQHTPFEYFAAPTLPRLMASMFSEFMIMRACGLTITTQTSLDLPLVPSVASAQAEIIAEVELYTSRLARAQLSLFAQVESVRETMQSLVPALKKRVGQTRRAVFDSGVQLIRDDLKDTRERLEASKQSFESFRFALATVDGEYQLAQRQVSEKLTGDAGEIRTLRARIKTLAGELDTVNDRIAEGASRKALKAVELGLQAASAVVGMPGVGELVMNTTFEVVNDEVLDDRDPLAESDKLLAQYSDSLRQLNHDLTQVAALGVLGVNVERFIRCVDRSTQLFANVADAFSDLESQLGDFPLVTGEDAITQQLTSGLALWNAQAAEAARFARAARNINIATKVKRYGHA